MYTSNLVSPHWLDTMWYCELAPFKLHVHAILVPHIIRLDQLLLWDLIGSNAPCPYRGIQQYGIWTYWNKSPTQWKKRYSNSPSSIKRKWLSSSFHNSVWLVSWFGKNHSAITQLLSSRSNELDNSFPELLSVLALLTIASIRFSETDVVFAFLTKYSISRSFCKCKEYK